MAPIEVLLCARLASAVGPSFGIVTELDDRHHMQHPVDAAMPDHESRLLLLIAGRGVDRSGAVPRPQVVKGGETADVPALNEIWAPGQTQAIAAVNALGGDFGAKCPKAFAKIIDLGTLLAFYDYRLLNALGG